MTRDNVAIRSALLKWYGVAARDLPWRRTSDPYRILVSELMLQQTQVKTVIPYYEKFLKRFPSAGALAKASEHDVLAAWAGLGYYRRARFLHAAAQAITAQRAFPRDLEGIRALPGVGDYTAAAVGSIAFGLAAAVVDGNVIRVLARLLALDADPTKGAGAAAIKEAAQALLDAKRPGDFNQAMMELGASLCSPTKPQCPACPLAKHCAAFLAGKPEAYPQLPARAGTRTLFKAVALVVAGKGPQAKVLARPRTAGKKPPAGAAADRLQGFWAFPEAELDGDDAAVAEAAATKEARKLAGKAASLSGRLPKLRHGITIYDIHLLPFLFTAAAGEPQAGWEWVTLAKLDKLPLAAAEKRLLAQLRAALQPGADEAQGQLGLKL